MQTRWLNRYFWVGIVYCIFSVQILYSADGIQELSGLADKPESLSLSAEKEQKQIQAAAHYAVAIIKELDGNIAEALEEFRLAALTDSNNEVIVISYVQRLLEQKKPTDALDILQLGVKNDQAPAVFYAWLGVVYAHLGQNEKAIESLNEAIKKAPQLVQAYQDLIKIHVQRGNFTSASAILKTAISQDSNDFNYFLEIAGTYLAFRSLLGKSADPIKVQLIGKLESTSKGNLSVFDMFRLADIYRLLSLPEKSIVLYRTLISKDPDMPGLRESLANALLQSGDKQGAIEQLKLLLEENPTNPQISFLIGGLFLEMTEYSKAVEYLEKTLALRPNLKEAYFELARAYLATKQPQKALDLMNKARTQNSDKFLIEFFSGIATSELKRYPEAIKYLSTAEVIVAVETNRPTEMLYFQLGAAYERNNQLDVAEKYFMKCLAKDPNSAEAMNYMGYMWAEKGIKLDQAKELIAKALQLEPENAAYLDSMAWVYYKLNNPQEALPLMLKAIEKNKTPDAVLYDHLGDIYKALGKNELAVDSWKKSVQIEVNPEVQKKIESVNLKEKSN